MLEEWLFSELPPNTTQHVISSGEWSPEVQFMVGALSLCVVGLTAWNYRSISNPWKRILMIGIRTALVGLLLFLFYQPTLLRETVQKSRNSVVFLLDQSESMALINEGESRAETLQKYLLEEEPSLQKILIDSDLKIFAFGDQLQALETFPQGQWPTHQEASNLLESIQGIQDELGSRDVAGIVVLSDGASTGLLSERLDQAKGLDDETRRILENLEAPIHFVSPTHSNRIKDVSVLEMLATPFAFHLNATEIGTTVRVTGYDPGTIITVTLFEDGEPLSSQTFPVEANKLEWELTFEVVPRRLGTRVYSAVVTPMPGEVYEENNEEHVLVKIMRDRLRVLQICGHPSWDQRFLRTFLKQDPDVDLISFFILINPRNAFAVSGKDTTLIPFPSRELFVEELGGFDLVIFQDFNYGPFSTRQHLWRIRDFVREGGAFLMIGGARTFSEGGYYGTEITEILPVEIAPSSGNGETTDLTTFQPQLTETGKRHPVTRLVPDPIDNMSLWGAVPSVDGINLSQNLKPNAVSLLDHPTLTNDLGQPQPLVAVTEAGEGRVMTVMTDSTWKWGFSEELKGSNLYTPFINNAIRWLIQDPELELTRVEVSDDGPTPGSTIQIKAEVYDTNYQLAQDHPVEITVKRRGTPLDQDNNVRYILQESGRTDANGSYTIQFTPAEKGIYDVEASARVGGRKSTAVQVIVSREHRLEAKHMIPRRPFTEWIAEATGGKHVDVSSGLDQLPMKSPDLLSVTQRKEIPIWAGSDILFLAFLLMGGEWWYRRQLGFL